MNVKSENEPFCVFMTNGEPISDFVDVESRISKEFQNLKVVVISIAGRFRQGKSFLLNILLRYLRKESESNWLGNIEGGSYESTAEGFPWKHSRKPVTMGVLIWPEIFKVRNAHGEDLAVVLMDTQGVFDTDSSMKENTSIFSLSVLLSSIQIFNLKQNFSGDDFSHLELFVGFSKLMASHTSDGNAASCPKPFQDLTFLVRDWSYPNENPYGWRGGEEVLNEELNKGKTAEELNAARSSIKNCFESVRCFLMPHPGKIVDSSPNFQGDTQDMDPDFVEHLPAFVAGLLAPENLKVKKVHGRELTVRDFCEYLHVMTGNMQNNKLPTPPALFEATVNAMTAAAVNESHDMYAGLMMELGAGSSDDFEAQHKMNCDKVLDHFMESTNELGNASARKQAKVRLRKLILSSKNHFKMFHDSRRREMLLQASIDKLSRDMKQMNDEARWEAQIQRDAALEELRGAREFIEALKKDQERNRCHIF